MRLDLGIVVPQLSNYGGAEVLLLECLRRWQHEADITLYSTALNETLLLEYGVNPGAVRFFALPTGRGGSVVDDLLVLPRQWEALVGHHDSHLLFLYPSHFVRRRPAVSLLSEPMRMIYDLRFQFAGADDISTAFHVYPRMRYEEADSLQKEAILSCIEELDGAPECDALVTLSERTSRYLESIYGRKADSVIYPGVDVPASVAPPPRGDVALYAGRLWRHKRVDLLLRAMSILGYGELHIAGDGPERDALAGLASELGIADRVHFKGALTRERLWRCYAGAACGVYTPVREPFGLMPLEMAAAGRPVVATADTGAAEILDSSCAMFVEPRPRCIAGALDELFRDPGRAALMGHAGRGVAAARSWDDTAGALLDVLLSVRRTRLWPVAGSGRPLLGAHYYVWYRAGSSPRHWNEDTDHCTVEDPPPEGGYSSSSPAVVRRHLALAKRAGLDFLVVNWQVEEKGIAPEELVATRALFDAVEEEHGGAPWLSVSLAIETTNFEAVTEALSTLGSEFAGRGCYHTRGGRPLVWYFLSDAFLGHVFHEHAALTELNDGYVTLASAAMPYSATLPRPLRSFFQGWSLYSPFQASAREDWPRVWRCGYRALVDDKPRAPRVFSISPGYDDRGLTDYSRSGLPNRHVPRAGGAAYDLMKETALSLSPPPEMVVVTSFNEFHENTHIEPSRRWGDAYVHATRRFSEALRNLWSIGSSAGEVVRGTGEVQHSERAADSASD